MKKLLWVVLLAMQVTQFVWYCEQGQRISQNRLLADLRWYAQLDAFGVYSKCINEQGDLLMGVLKRERMMFE